MGGGASQHWSVCLLLLLWTTAGHAEGRKKKSFINSHFQGSRAFNRYELHPIDDVHQDGEICTPSWLWGKEANDMSFEIGCDEVDALVQNRHGDGFYFAGEGAARYVYVARYEGEPIAIKMLKQPFLGEWKTLSQERQQEQRQWEEERRLQQWAEVVTMDAMNGKRDVVQLRAVCNHTNTLVSEAYPDNLEMYVLREQNRPIRDIVTMSLDAARGLRALHDHPGAPIVHFDIKPSQFLLTDGRDNRNGKHVKLNDFNLAWFMSTRPDGRPCKFASRRWFWTTPLQAPEYRWQQPMDEKVDIFGLAWVFYFMLNGWLPFGDDRWSQDRFMQETGGIPEFNLEWHSGFVEVVRDMFVQNPEQRPSAREVVGRLETILEELPEL